LKKHLHHIIIGILFCLGFFIGVHAQEPADFNFEVITSENTMLQKGLSANTVYTLMQDSYGYLWFGTWDGLNKFDGYNFVTYNRMDGLSNETVNALIETDDGNVWIGTDVGLNCLRRGDDSVLVFLHRPDDSATISHNKINFLLQDQPGRILLGTDGGFNIIDLETYEVKRYHESETQLQSAPGNQINYILKSSAGIYWLGTNFGLLEYNPNTLENTRHLHRPEDPHSLSSNRVRAIYEDDRHRIWVGTENGLSLLNRRQAGFRVFRHDKDDPQSLSHNFVESVYQDKSGNFWIGTDGGGLNLLDTGDFSFAQVQSWINDAGGLSSNRVYDIIEDTEGNVWFGTFNGVNIWNKFKPHFHHFKANPYDPESLSNNFVWAFIEYRPQIIWVGTDDGIGVFNANTGKFSPLSEYFTSDNKLSSDRVRSLLKDKNNNVWIGTRDQGLNKLDTKTGRVYQFKPSVQYHNSLCGNYVINLYEDKNGLIWVATNNGLNTIDPITHAIRVFRHAPDDSASISSNTIYDFLEDKQGNFWIATLDGLNLFHPETQSFTVYRNHGPESDPVSTDRLFCLYEDSNDNFWLGTRGGGLELFDRQTHTFQSYTTKNGLPNNVVYTILEDSSSNLWMSTNWGIAMMDTRKNTFVNYDVSDGLQSNEFNVGAKLKSLSGQLFFGGMKGFNVFTPGSIRINPSKPKILITSFKKFNQAQPGQVSDGDTIILSYNENFFSFEFSTLDFINANRSKYGYLLKNYSHDWTYVDGRRHFAEYTNVNPGNYTFMVVGASSNGVWNKDGIAVTVIVKPPWHQTWYFKTLVVLFFLFLIWLIIYSRVRRIRRKHVMEKKVLKIEKQLFDIQQKALRLQMNPHFIFNSLNSIQSFIITNDIDLAVNYLSRFSQLMRLILVNSSEAVIPLADEIAAVKHYIEIEQLRFDNKFDYTIIIDPEIDEEFTGVPPMIIQPYIENAVIHGLVNKKTSGSIKIEFKRKGEMMLCTIVDDGIGRQAATEIKRQNGLNAKSRGMMITKERLDILNKGAREKYSVKVFDLKDTSGKPAGTRVEVLITIQEV